MAAWPPPARTADRHGTGRPPGCSASFSAADEDGILVQVAGHAAADHGVTDITPELVAAVRIRIVSA